MGKRKADESIVSEAAVGDQENAGPTTQKEEYETLCALVSSSLKHGNDGSCYST